MENTEKIVLNNHLEKIYLRVIEYILVRIPEEYKEIAIHSYRQHLLDNYGSKEELIVLWPNEDSRREAINNLCYREFVYWKSLSTDEIMSILIPDEAFNHVKEIYDEISLLAISAAEHGSFLTDEELYESFTDKLAIYYEDVRQENKTVAWKIKQSAEENLLFIFGRADTVPNNM